MNVIAIAPNFTTEEELWELSQDGYRYELIEGELCTMTPTGGEHGGYTADLGAYVTVFVKEHGLGRCFGAETGFEVQADPKTILAPDFAFIRKERVPVPLPQKFVPVVPDLVLEVRSPGDRATEVAGKIGRWLDAGTLIVWELNPRTKKLTVFRPDAPALELGAGDMLDVEPLLSNWSLPLNRIF